MTRLNLVCDYFMDIVFSYSLWRLSVMLLSIDNIVYPCADYTLMFLLFQHYEAATIPYRLRNFSPHLTGDFRTLNLLG